jgi:hypothetical protein
MTRDFYVSHQWLRELKRRGQGPIVGIYFRIPDGESVWIGHYGRPHEEVTAAAAASTFSESQNRQGWGSSSLVESRRRRFIGSVPYRRL